MKKISIYIIIILLFITSCNNRKHSYTILSGDTIISSSDTLYLFDKKYDTIKKIYLKNNKTFIDTLDVKTGYYYLKTSNSIIDLFLEPNSDLNLSFIQNAGNDSVFFKEKIASINNYLFQKTKLKDRIGIKEAYPYYAKLDEKEFLNETDSIKNLYLELLNNFPNLNKRIFEIERNNIKYDILFRLSNYQDFRRYVTDNKTFEVSDNYPKYYENINLSDEKALITPSYMVFIMYYLNKITAEKINFDTENSDFSIAYLKTLNNEIENETLKNDIIYYILKTSLNKTKELDSFYHIANNNLTNEKYKTYLRNEYNLIKKAQKEAFVPNFRLIDNYGKFVSLSDFKGQLVYIDIWATWCTPCVKEIPYLKKTEEYFKNKDVTFISICKSDTKVRWLAKIKNDKLGGIQLFAESDDLQFFKHINLKGIPRFILVDKEGRLIDYDAPRPSNENLIKLIEKNL